MQYSTVYAHPLMVEWTFQGAGDDEEEVNF